MLLACGALHVSGSDCVLLYVVAGGQFRFYIISHFIHGIHTEIMMENQSGGNATKTLSQNNDTANAWWRPKEQRIHAQMKIYSKLQNFGMHWRAPIIQIACGLLTVKKCCLTTLALADAILTTKLSRTHTHIHYL